MTQPPRRGDDGFTGLELVITVVALIIVTALLLVHLGGGGMPAWARTFPGGLVAESMYVAGDNVQLAGNVYGFPAVSGTYGKTRTVFSRPDPGRLGIVRMSVSLFMGSTGAIDMDRLEVTWKNGDTVVDLVRTPGPALSCPNWTISDKYNMLPGRTADSDDWLEPGEQFELTFCPVEGLQPYSPLVLTLRPEGVAMPLRIRRNVPPQIQPVMNLG